MNGYIHLKHLLSSRGTPKPYKALGTSCHTLSQDSFLIQTVLDQTEIPVSLASLTISAVAPVAEILPMVPEVFEGPCGVTQKPVLWNLQSPLWLFSVLSPGCCGRDSVVQHSPSVASLYSTSEIA